MFGLIKLAAYVLFGYALYEFIRGIMYGAEGGGGIGGMARQAGQQFGRQMQQQGQGGGGQEDFGGRMNISGPGEGRTETTGEDRGTATSHKVGRGVVS